MVQIYPFGTRPSLSNASGILKRLWQQFLHLFPQPTIPELWYTPPTLPDMPSQFETIVNVTLIQDACNHESPRVWSLQTVAGFLECKVGAYPAVLDAIRGWWSCHGHIWTSESLLYSKNAVVKLITVMSNNYRWCCPNGPQACLSRSAAQVQEIFSHVSRILRTFCALVIQCFLHIGVWIDTHGPSWIEVTVNYLTEAFVFTKGLSVKFGEMLQSIFASVFSVCTRASVMDKREFLFSTQFTTTYFIEAFRNVQGLLKNVQSTLQSMLTRGFLALMRASSIGGRALWFCLRRLGDSFVSFVSRHFHL